MKTTKNILFDHYIHAGKLLCKLIGSDLEIVIQEGGHKNSPVLAIFKGEKHLVQKSNIYTDTSLLDNYNRSNRNHMQRKEIQKKETLKVEDSQGKVIGLFTIHWHMENTKNIVLLLNTLCNQQKEIGENKMTEKMISPEKEIKTFIKHYIKKNQSIIFRKKEHIQLIRQLYDAHFFAKKHSIRIAATELDLAEVTIYKYIADYKKESQS